jgi:hypothetical protein
VSGHSTRRTFLASIAAAGAVSAQSAAEAAGSPSPSRRRKSGGKESKGLAYLEMIIGMTEDLLAESAPDIDRAGAICAEAVKAGKKLFYTVRGHNEPLCILENRPGKPAFLLPTEQTIDPAIFSPGDVLITERTQYCAPAKERGVKLVGILMPFLPQKKQGQGIVHIDYAGPWMEEICDVCIWDRVPYTVGTMCFDQLPFKAVPAHGAMDGIILSLILASAVDRLLEGGVTVTVK